MPYHLDRKSTRLNSSHLVISYAVFCLKKKKKKGSTVPTTSGCYDYQTSVPDAEGLFEIKHADVCFGCEDLILPRFFFFFFFFNDTATTEIYTLSLHDALPI